MQGVCATLMINQNRQHEDHRPTLSNTVLLVPAATCMEKWSTEGAAMFGQC
jgi:hypothetical protein